MVSPVWSHNLLTYYHKEHEILLISAQYRLDYTIMKQSGECPSSDKWSPAMGHSTTIRHNPHRHYNRNYCHHLHYHHYHHHQHIYHCNHQYVNANRSKNKTLRNDNRYHSSFHLSVIFLNALFYNRNVDDDDVKANTNADNDDDDNDNADAKYDMYNGDETFLTEDPSWFMVQSTSFASSYVW